MALTNAKAWRFALALLIVVAAAFGSGTPSVFAETGALQAASVKSFEQEAAQLREWGLFHGTNRGFELDRAPTRTEAIVMLVRLLGKEEEARHNPDLSHPFTDVPAWADRAVAYAYENGLTSGVSATQFGAHDPVTAPQYSAFVLRALGYDDRGGDFDWREAARVIERLGLGAKERYESFDGPFLRGHVADISYHALFLGMKEQETTLLEKLVEEEVLPLSALEIKKEDGDEAASGEEETEAGNEEAEGNGPGDGSFVVPVTVLPNEWNPAFSVIHVNDGHLLEHLPGARYESLPMYGLFPQDRALQLEIALLKKWAPRDRMIDTETLDGVRKYGFNPGDSGDLGVRVLYDGDDNPIAYTTLAELSADRSSLTYHTKVPERVEALVKRAQTIAENAVLIPHDALFVTEIEYVIDVVDDEPVMGKDRVVDIDRSRLPERSRHFVKRIQKAYPLRHDGTGATIRDIGALTRFVQNMQQQLYAHELEGLNLTFDYHPLQLGEYAGKWALFFEFFLDENDEILAYAYFADSDLRAWAERLNR